MNVRIKRFLRGLLAAFSIAGGALLFGCGDDNGAGSNSGGVPADGFGPSITYGGKTYATVVIGGKTWMAENLNYETSSGSWCYEDSPDSCDKYGRLYDWATAMGLNSSYNNEKWGGSDVKHKGICPDGWHLSSLAEWDHLAKSVGGEKAVGYSAVTPNDVYWKYVGKKLKSTDGWDGILGRDDGSGNGTDDYGFAALGGGQYDNKYGYSLSGNFGTWWTTTESKDQRDAGRAAYTTILSCCDEELLQYPPLKTIGFSVRCVKN